MPETKFVKCYRVSKELFNEILVKLKLHLEKTAEEGNEEGKLKYYLSLFRSTSRDTTRKVPEVYGHRRLARSRLLHSIPPPFILIE